LLIQALSCKEPLQVEILEQIELVINEHKGEHCREPFIARVLLEAAMNQKTTQYVKILLEDDVHPDSRVNAGDESVLCKVARHHDEYSRLLGYDFYEKGARLSMGPPYPWRLWGDNNDKIKTANRKQFDWYMDQKKSYSVRDNTPTNPVLEDKKNIKSNFQALLVDTCLVKYDGQRSSTNTGETERVGKLSDESLDERGKDAENPLGKQGDEKSGEFLESHLIAHPSVAELLDKGPDECMEGSDGTVSRLPKEFLTVKKVVRWIHLPVNHVSSSIYLHYG